MKEEEIQYDLDKMNQLHRILRVISEKRELDMLFVDGDDSSQWAMSYWIESQRVLDLLTDKNGVIHHDLNISGRHILSFNKVKVIKGNVLLKIYL